MNTRRFCADVFTTTGMASIVSSLGVLVSRVWKRSTKIEYHAPFTRFFRTSFPTARSQAGLGVVRCVSPGRGAVGNTTDLG